MSNKGETMTLFENKLYRGGLAANVSRAIWNLFSSHSGS